LTATASGSSEELYDVLDRRVSFVVGSFEFALGPMRGVRKVMEAAVSKRSAQAFVEEQEQEGTWMPLDSLRSKS